MILILEGDIGGFWTSQYRRKICQIPQYYNTVSKLDVILKPLHCTLSLEQITRKQKLRLGNVRLRQNKQNKEHPVACWLIIKKKWNDRKLEKARKTLEDLKENYLSRSKCQKTASRRFGEYRNSLKIKITEISQEKLSNTAIPQTPMSPSF